MPIRLTDNLSSLYVSAANSLRPKHSRKRIVCYVESYDDIMFWRGILSAYENDRCYVEIMLPSRSDLTKGKKQAMMNVLGESLGQNMIACVDADYDYLLQGRTECSRQLIESKYIFHTYAYAIENYQCSPERLHEVCCAATLNDREVVDFKAFYQMYSRIVYRLFLWNVYFYRKGDLRTFSILDFSNVARLSSVDVAHLEECLTSLDRHVKARLHQIESEHHSEIREVDALARELEGLGVREDNVYCYVQGHHLFDRVTLKLLIPLCAMLRTERENEIRHLACHDTQMQNELSSYQHSMCSVELMLKKVQGTYSYEPFEKLKADLDAFFAEI